MDKEPYSIRNQDIIREWSVRFVYNKNRNLMIIIGKYPSKKIIVLEVEKESLSELVEKTSVFLRDRYPL